MVVALAGALVPVVAARDERLQVGDAQLVQPASPPPMITTCAPEVAAMTYRDLRSSCGVVSWPGCASVAVGQ